MKRLLIVALLLSVCFAFAMAEEKAPVEVTAEAAMEGPYLVTTCGQSPGAVMVGMSGMQSGKKVTYNNTLTAEDVVSDEFKTLIITTGTSMKGMGAAGTDIDAEIARCLAVAEAAKNAGMKVVCAHIEGMARRTDSSDTASIEAIIEVADIILVVEESDSDGFFSTYAKGNDKPIIIVKDALGVGEIL